MHCRQQPIQQYVRPFIATLSIVTEKCAELLDCEAELILESPLTMHSCEEALERATGLTIVHSL